VEEAVYHLREDGVVVRLGDMVGIGRAAMRYGKLMRTTGRTTCSRVVNSKRARRRP
jgi:alkylated DNA nucleotide flippase Atl1